MTNPPQLPSDVPLWPEEARPAPPKPPATARPAEPTPGNPLWDPPSQPAPPPPPSAGSFSLPPADTAGSRRTGGAPPPPPPPSAAPPAPPTQRKKKQAPPPPPPPPPATTAAQPSYEYEQAAYTPASYDMPSYESSREPYNPQALVPDYQPQGEAWQPPPPLPPATTGGQKVGRVFRIAFGLLFRGIGRCLWLLGRAIERGGLKMAPPRPKAPRGR